MSRSPKEIVEQTHELAEAFYRKHGYLHDRAKHGNLYESTHPQEQLMWELACMAQIELTDTDPMDAMSDLDEEQSEGSEV